MCTAAFHTANTEGVSNMWSVANRECCWKRVAERKKKKKLAIYSSILLPTYILDKWTSDMPGET